MQTEGEKVKIVAIGAGSASFGHRVVTNALGTKELGKLDCTLTLVDINEEALQRMLKLATMLKKHFGSPVKLEATTDRVEALKEANYVTIAVARKRYELWEQDFRAPLAYGFKHVYGENGGPGAAFHTMRSLDLVVPICKDAEKICPDALVLNYTNPESRVVMAINYLTRIKAVGLCHGVLDGRWKVAEVLGKPLEDLQIVTGGINHFYWVLEITDAETGEDLYPEFRKRVKENPTFLPPLVRKMVEVFGCLTYPYDSHPGEYLSFAHDLTGLKWPLGRESRSVADFERSRGRRNWLDPYIRGEKPLDERVTTLDKWGELAIPIICDIELDREMWRPTVNVLNDGGYVENLPTDGVVEVPAIVDGQGIHPQKVGPLPEALAAFTRRQISIQKLLVEAYRTRSKNLLLQALLLDPVVDSVSNAEKLLEDMFELQSEYLPEFH